MFIVNDILGDLQEVLGECDTALIYRRLNAALDLIGSFLNTDSNISVMDICTQGCEMTLPYEVEVPLAININGAPADFRNKWFEHHLNGTGSQCCQANCTYSWQNQGLYPTFRDLTEPSYLAAYADSDEGVSKSIIVFGEDEHGKPLYSCQGTSDLKPGLLLPIPTGIYALSRVEGGPKVRRITQIYKPVTSSFVRLIAFDSGRTEGTLIGYYRPEEQVPAYRRLQLAGTCDASRQSCQSSLVNPASWVRMRYQRRQMPITSLNDIIFVPSKEAVVNAVNAIRFYRDSNKALGDTYLATARAALEEKQESLEGPNTFQAQYPKDGVYGGDQVCNMI